MSLDELVVLSHLRWTWVWQRPQHLVSRLAAGRRTWFVEEPLAAPVSEPVLRTERCGLVTRVWLDVPAEPGWVGFDDPSAKTYPRELSHLLGSTPDRAVWLYTPVALPIAQALNPSVLVYDVMDDLASFKDASPGMLLARRRALQRADVVFTGGRTLHAATVLRRPEHTYLFPSGVEPEHYRPAIHARTGRGPQERPVAGYVGVIDERLDYDLIRDMAGELPDWTIRMVGPLTKVDPALLPQARNIEWVGACEYRLLPEVMAGFDVALMPFALNEATRSISPTKTLEYLAAGLPVVSSRVPDVVADYEGIVDLADEGKGFAAACRRVINDPPERRAVEFEPLLRWHHWDLIAARMARHLEVARWRNGRVTDVEKMESEAIPAS